MIEVLRPGSLTTIQDLGRPGLAHLGVPPSGAADARSLRLANRLVGNHDGAAGLEATVRGPVLAFARGAVIALAGATADARIGDRQLAMHAVEHVRAGDVLELGWIRGGARTYVAVRGGIAAERVLGSAAADLLTGLGPPPLTRGVVLETGTAAARWPATDAAPVPAIPAEPTLRVVPGPRQDRFAADAMDRLCGQLWTVTAHANRVGVRLSGVPLERSSSDELPSEGMVAGSLEVPPAGHPILLLTDHPTTGGYPVIAVVASDDLPLAGQLVAGGRLRFRAVRGSQDRPASRPRPG